MDTVFELNNIETLPNNTLTILKDDFGKDDIYSLYLKNNFLEHPASIDFRIGFVDVNNIPMLVLLVKIKDKIYKNLVSFYFSRELNYLKKLLTPTTFNLFLFSNDNKGFVYKIDNKHHYDLSKAISAVESRQQNKSSEDVRNAKQEILNRYTDEELWELAK